ncbi:TrmB family transcriptional regulator [Streptomyces malaysiensis]|uniref:Vegetative cell wall protein gp1 n=1 Tax=Streptomyces malaysiensis TaxID=92644 RepID=A0A7X5XBS4_STRMQ|nr:TrmB family transcriptional regulator [Streptomyces malaysiensis]NIY69535.1 vegetative cell wall protein gp1 [Streptomyces malaysiensis]
MSDTTTTDQLAGLPSAVITVYAQLVAFTEPATVGDIATAAETARSSTFKALVTLEKRGLAHRNRGIQNGPKRCPDLWRAGHTDSSPTPGEPPTQAEPAEPTITGEPAAETVETKTKTEPRPEPESPEENADVPEPTDTEETDAALSLPTQHTQPAHLDPIAAVPGGNQRLAPGCLRQLVIDHLNAHPGETFTATRISRAIERSSGAIANALATLVKQGIAEKINDHPRTYRAATAEQPA